MEGGAPAGRRKEGESEGEKEDGDRGQDESGNGESEKSESVEPVIGGATLSSGGPSSQGDTEAKGDGKGDRAEEQRAGKRLGNNFHDRSATELKRVAQVALEDVADVAGELLGE